MQKNQNTVELKQLREQYGGNIDPSMSSLDMRFNAGYQYQKRENQWNVQKDQLRKAMKDSSLHRRMNYRPSSAAPVTRRYSAYSP